MFFELSKIAWFLLTPSNALLGIALVGLGLAVIWRKRAGAVVALVAVCLLALLGLSPAGNLMIGALEDRFPAWEAGGRAPTGIVILGGATDTELSAIRAFPAVNEAGERLMAAVALARRYPQARIFFTGGNGTLGGAGNESDDARVLFEALGVPPDRVTYERESRNTFENAVLTQRLANPRPGETWLLVTSAYHMPRSIGVFRAAGFAVEAYPVDWRTAGPGRSVRPFAAVSDGLRRSDTALREWMGLIAYRLTGRSSALFPAP